MASSKVYRVCRACKVDIVALSLGCFKLFLEFVDALLRLLLEFIDSDTHSLFLVGSYIAEVCHQGIYFTFLTEVFQSELLYFLSVLSGECLHLFQ